MLSRLPLQIESKKLEWKVESRVGSLDNTKHKAGGGAKKVIGALNVFASFPYPVAFRMQGQENICDFYCLILYANPGLEPLFVTPVFSDYLAR